MDLDIELLALLKCKDGGGGAKLHMITVDRNGLYRASEYGYDGFSAVTVNAPIYAVGMMLRAATSSDPLTVLTVYPPDGTGSDETLLQVMNERPWLLNTPNTPNRNVGELSLTVPIPNNVGTQTIFIPVRIKSTSVGNTITGVQIVGGSFDDSNNYFTAAFGVDENHNGRLFLNGATGMMGGMPLDTATVSALFQGATDIVLTMPVRVKET